MHELQVHRIELEMQNEELKQAYDTEETALKYDNKPLRRVYIEGIVIVDEQKCLLSVVDISGFVKEDNP